MVVSGGLEGGSSSVVAPGSDTHISGIIGQYGRNAAVRQFGSAAVIDSEDRARAIQESKGTPQSGTIWQAGQKPLATSEFTQAMQNPLRQAQTRVEVNQSIANARQNYIAKEALLRSPESQAYLASAKQSWTDPRIEAAAQFARANRPFTQGSPVYSNDPRYSQQPTPTFTPGQPVYSPQYQQNLSQQNINTAAFSLASQTPQQTPRNPTNASLFVSPSPPRAEVFGPPRPIQSYTPPSRDASTVLGSGYGRTPQQQQAFDSSFKQDQTRAAVNAGLSPEAGRRMNINYQGKGAYTSQVLAAIKAENEGKRFTPSGSTVNYVYRRFGSSNLSPSSQPPETMPEVRNVAVGETRQLYAPAPSSGPLQRIADNTFGVGPTFTQDQSPSYTRVPVEVARAPATYTNAQPRQAQAILDELTAAPSSTVAPFTPTRGGKTTISAPLPSPTSLKSEVIQDKSDAGIRKFYDAQTSVSTPTISRPPPGTRAFAQDASGQIVEVNPEPIPSKTYNLPASSYSVVVDKGNIIITNREQLVSPAVQKSIETGLPIKNIDTGVTYPSAKYESPTAVSNQILRDMPSAAEYQPGTSGITSNIERIRETLEARYSGTGVGNYFVENVVAPGGAFSAHTLTAPAIWLEGYAKAGQTRLKTGDVVDEFSAFSKGVQSGVISFIPIVGSDWSKTYSKNVGGLDVSSQYLATGTSAALNTATVVAFSGARATKFMKANPTVALGLPVSFGSLAIGGELSAGKDLPTAIVRGASATIVPMGLFALAGAKVSGKQQINIPARNVEVARNVNLEITSASKTPSGATAQFSGYADALYKRLPNIPFIERLPRSIVERLPGKKTSSSSTIEGVADIKNDPTSFSPIIGAKGGKTVMKVQATVSSTAYPGRAIDESSVQTTGRGASLKGKLPYYPTETTAKPLGAARPQSFEMVPPEAYEPPAQRLDATYKLGKGITKSGVGSPVWEEQKITGVNVKVEAEPTARVETTQETIKGQKGRPDVVFETSYEEGTGLKKPEMEVSGPAASEEIKLIAKASKSNGKSLSLKAVKFTESALKTLAEETKPNELPFFNKHEPFYNKKIDLFGRVYTPIRGAVSRAARRIGISRESMKPINRLDDLVFVGSEKIEFALAKRVGSVKSLTFKKGSGATDSKLYHTTEITSPDLMREIRSGKTSSVSITAEETGTVSAFIEQSQMGNYAQDTLQSYAKKGYYPEYNAPVPVRSTYYARALELSGAGTNPRDPAAFFNFVKYRVPAKFAPEPNTPTLLGFKNPKVTIAPIVENLPRVAGKPSNLEAGQPKIYNVETPSPSRTVLRRVQEGAKVSRDVIGITDLTYKPGQKVARPAPSTFEEVFPDVTPPSGKATQPDYQSANPLDFAFYKQKGAPTQPRSNKGFGPYEPATPSPKGSGGASSSVPKGEAPSPPGGFDLTGEFPPKPPTSEPRQGGNQPSGGTQASMNQEYPQSRQARRPNQQQMWEEQRPSTQLTMEQRASIGSAIEVPAPKAKAFAIEVPKFDFPEGPLRYRSAYAPQSYVSPVPSSQKERQRMDELIGVYQQGKQTTRFLPATPTFEVWEKPHPPIQIPKPDEIIIPREDIITGTKQNTPYGFGGGGYIPPYSQYVPEETTKGRRFPQPPPYFMPSFPGGDRGGGPGYSPKQSQSGFLLSVLGLPMGPSARTSKKK